jgi:hypothetical protein
MGYEVSRFGSNVTINMTGHVREMFVEVEVRMVRY